LGSPVSHSYPTARLIALTPETQAALAAPGISVTVVPFHVGRDLRDPGRFSFRIRINRRRARVVDPNHLYLPEDGARHRLSHEHFTIGINGEGFFLEDRCSACGTLVEGRVIGGNRQGGKCPLKSGDVIIPGGSHSPFVFKFLAPGAADPKPDA